MLGTDFCPTWLWGLANLYGAIDRVYGERERGFHANDSLWLRGRCCRGAFRGNSTVPVGIQPAVYALRGCRGSGKARTWREMGCGGGAGPVRGCLDCGCRHQDYAIDINRLAKVSMPVIFSDTDHGDIRKHILDMGIRFLQRCNDC